MSGNKNQDAFATCQAHADTFFDGVKKYIPQYHQSVTNYQQQCLTAWEDAVKTSIDNRAKVFGKINLPDSVIKSGDSIAKEFTNAFEIQQKIFLFGIDTAQQGVRAIADGAKFYNGYLDTWFSFFKKE